MRRDARSTRATSRRSRSSTTAIAIAFILFDLETVFLFIWALGAQPLTGFMLVTFVIFTFLLVLILLYVYKARLLEAVTE